MAMPLVDAHLPGPAEGSDPVPAGDGRPLVMVAIDHPMMRALTGELLERNGTCRVRAMGAEDQALADAIDLHHPRLVIVDTGEFPACCRSSLRRFPSERMIVIGPEPAGSYRTAALAAGAGAWVSCDRVGDDLIAGVCRVLGNEAPPPSTPGP